MTIPDAAIEAAAEAFYAQTFPLDEWANAFDSVRQVHRGLARAAIEAAMPAIREAIAQEDSRSGLSGVFARIPNAIQAGAVVPTELINPTPPQKFGICDENSGDLIRLLTISHEDWDALGRPESIAVDFRAACTRPAGMWEEIQMKDGKTVTRLSDGALSDAFEEDA